MKKLCITAIALLSIATYLDAYKGYGWAERHEGSYGRTQGRSFCQNCCSSGKRFVSDECLQRCGGCSAYNDSAAAEGRDYPG